MARQQITGGNLSPLFPEKTPVQKPEFLHYYETRIAGQYQRKAGDQYPQFPSAFSGGF
jgi:hypothetical protein